MPEEEEEGGFTFRDRRRLQTDAPAPLPQPAPSPSLAPSEPARAQDDNEALYGAEGDEEGADEESGEIPDVRSVLALFMGELRNLAWLRMGLVANPMTGQMETDLAQAKIAIDTVGFLAQQLEPHVAPEERLPLKAMITDLQLNFVEQSKRG